MQNCIINNGSYPEGEIFGKEVVEGILKVANVDTILKCIKNKNKFLDILKFENLYYYRKKIKPELCGISDYVNLLAKELTKNNHKVFIVEVSKSKDFKHISKNLPNAQFYSFQFAPYLYSEKGISGRSIMEFAESLRDKNVQFNFHEIWIGANKTAKFLDKIGGW